MNDAEKIRHAYADCAEEDVKLRKLEQQQKQLNAKVDAQRSKLMDAKDKLLHLQWWDDPEKRMPIQEEVIPIMRMNYFKSKKELLEALKP